MQYFKDTLINKELDKCMVHRFGLMVVNTRVNGLMVKLVDRVDFGMQMEIDMKENGQMIKLMGMEFTYMLMEQNT